MEPYFERNPATEMAHPPTQESSTTETQPPPLPEQTDRDEQPQDDQPAEGKPPPVEQTQMPFPISPSAPEPDPSPPVPEPNKPAPENGPASSSRSRELKRAAERVRADLKQHHLSEEEKAKRLFRHLIRWGSACRGRGSGISHLPLNTVAALREQADWTAGRPRRDHRYRRDSARIV